VNRTIDKSVEETIDEESSFWEDLEPDDEVVDQ